MIKHHEERNLSRWIPQENVVLIVNDDLPLLVILQFVVCPDVVLQKLPRKRLAKKAYVSEWHDLVPK